MCKECQDNFFDEDLDEENLPEDGFCFACGVKNPIGLHLDFHIDDEHFKAEKTLNREYQSFTGVVHGGIVSTMLDEAMGGYLYNTGEKAVTARMEIRYRKPTPVGAKLFIEGWVVSRKGRFIDLKSQISLEDGSITAEGKARMALVE